MKVFGFVILLVGIYFLSPALALIWSAATLGTLIGFALVGGGVMALGGGKAIKQLAGRKVKQLSGGYD